MKYCPKCGQPLEDYMVFCSKCGAAQETAAPTSAPAPVIEQSAVSPMASESAKKAMILGIVAAATSELGVPGIVLASICKKEISRAEELGAQGAKLRVARICRKVGLIGGIIMTVFWAIYIPVIIAAVAANL